MSHYKESELVNHLEELGLTDYEIKVYSNLIQNERVTASEIAQLSGVPRTKSYEILSNLCNKGLCIEIPDNVRKYSAVEPVIAINSLRAKAEEDFTSRIGIIEAIQSQLEEIYANRSTEDDSTAMIQVFREKNTIWQKVQDLLASAEKEILVFSKEPYLVSVGH